MSQVAAIQSAQTVAALRAAVTNETSLAVACEDRLAKHFISLRERILTAVLPQPLIRWALERAAPGSYGFAIARTRCFDDALLCRGSRRHPAGRDPRRRLRLPRAPLRQ